MATATSQNHGAVQGHSQPGLMLRGGIALNRSPHGIEGFGQ